MKVLIGVLALIFSMQVNADCLNKKGVTYLPVGVLVEFCFVDEVKSIKWGADSSILYTLEKVGDIPSSYKEKGIKNVIGATAMKSGLKLNFFVDTVTGNRTEFTVITEPNEITVNKLEES